MQAYERLLSILPVIHSRHAAIRATQVVHVHILRDELLLGLLDLEPEAPLFHLQFTKLFRQRTSPGNCFLLLTYALVFLPKGLHAELGAHRHLPASRAAGGRRATAPLTLIHLLHLATEAHLTL